MLWETQNQATNLAAMDDGKGQPVKCAWDGDHSTWVDYIRRVRLTYERTRHLDLQWAIPLLPLWSSLDKPSPGANLGVGEKVKNVTSKL